MSTMPVPASEADIRHNLAAVHARIAAACREHGRDPATIRLLPVSKTWPEATLRAAHAAGIREFGENKVQEAQAKAEALADLDLRWCVIGHLQRNKAKYVARFAHEFQALDSLRLATELDRRLQAEGRGIDVFVQVNTSDEPNKFGIAPDQARDLLAGLTACASLRVRGLMTLAIFDRDPVRVRRCFRRLRELRDRLREDLPAGITLDELSMGMSGDFPLAIAEGASVLRIGQAIFGPRATPDSEYWPTAGQ
ncbi:YggS family pyridoxal phosphate-dependent enzyme [Luteimonas sp. e5]